ncbi:tRNA uridine-5-carboxymethylaminomethyl(34) synthesis GTPase MnmE [Candidatus Mycoplasma mahonii]|uniref:tRNA uridine-5-carboxymethylaminomethyl(34) synthesis GTPase MnmE n=1 Tax=Candidatus Mycoplasma mahonii TaxID=3004105 RepID=UPI0026F2345C|nr:tRNA uridine-5-carboxymethylaminomethyl(34) synthesis GTPase MnmE [Candidatus Mycoplasma mahonii]WKX02421.1 tRNA uridine-5-carboxymethylaminomethyl(34) synthesis GTPase MnmE [Candidatus Mycoplasma mahonii]
MFDTIVAISSGLINQPISIIRLSGPEAFTMVKKIFKGKIGKDKTITYGHIVDHNVEVDEVLVSWFKAPNTFTGEDIVEINAHGGVVNSNNILKLLLINGARMAERGEFSRRAFLNGKMDIIKAEAIHDLIFAKTDEQAKISAYKFKGETSDLIKNLKFKLLTIIATCETNIDYPEYDDVAILTTKELIPALTDVQNDIENILDVSKSSRYIFDGVMVAIVGKPNAGKSSLLNALLNEDKAIVSNIPGTTRDVVEGSIQIGQILLNFKDTAGIHTTNDSVEQMGIKKSLNQIKDADLVIHVIDPMVNEDQDDLKIKKASSIKTYIRVLNKSDLKKEMGISISAKNGNIKELINEIKKVFKKIDIYDTKIINNTRQLSLIESANKAIKNAISELQSGETPDVVIIDIQRAWEDLSNILGRAEQADLLDNMFSHFCLGK